MSENADPIPAFEPGQLARREEAQAVSVVAHWSGPLPPPAELQAYENALPGCAERIVAMAESQAQHRQRLEWAETQAECNSIEAEIASERRGAWLGFIVTVVVIGLSTYLIIAGFLAIGIGLISVGLISLVGLFIYGRNHPRS